tara:strand:- start:159 stop:1406 length:1248 start_codon:yes stop_codon:yes gene_type:complete
MLINGNCLEEMKNIEDNSVDLIFCDLPYGQTSCKWDCCIDLNLFWKEIMRIKILNAPIIMTTTTKFGVSLIQSAPKKCPFRYDLIWCKSAPCGFLSAKKMPMRKHEMIYVFYEKLPFYDLSSHKHKFIKETVNKRNGKDGVDNKGMIKNRSKTEIQNKYNPPLPTSLIKEEKHDWVIPQNTELYGKAPTENNVKLGGHQKRYDPPLPTSLIKEEPPELNLDECNNCKYDVNKNTYGGGKEGRIKISKDKKDHQQKYDPPLPTSLIKENNNHIKDGQIYNGGKGMNVISDGKGAQYNPPLPTSLIKEDIYGQTTDIKNNFEESVGMNKKERKEVRYDPPLPNSLLEIKSTRGKHSTEKPVQLMEWVLKYYSKEGDTVLDPTMGSGSTGVACKNMNRKFIGIEMDKDIYDGAVKRLE